MKTGTKIITLDNGYHLWTNTQGEGDIHLLALMVVQVVITSTGKMQLNN